MPGRARETREQINAYEMWRGLGFKRSFREVARRMDKSAQTVATWAGKFNWVKRLQEYSTGVASMKAKGELIESDDPVIQQISTMLRQAQAAIDSVFIKNADGTISSAITIVNADDLSKIIREYRQLLETYRKMVAERDGVNPNTPGKPSPPGKVNVKNLNVHFGDIPQDKRINILEGFLLGNGPGGNREVAGGVQDGDYTDVPEQRDEDGHGREGVPGGATDSDSRDETPLWES